MSTLLAAFVIALGLVGAILGAIEVVRSRLASLLAWGLCAVSVAVVLIAASKLT